MPQQLNQQTVNRLIRGFITEAGELSFPEEATIDELNCVLGRDGSRKRRLGLKKLDASVALSTVGTDLENYSYFTWKNAGGNTGLDILVLQLGSKVSFYDMTSTPLTNGEKSFTIDLETYSPNGYSTLRAVNQYTQLFGTLVIANPYTETLVVEYSIATDTITVSEISFRVRDFEWQSDYDLLDRSIKATTVSDQRKYDTYNAGWFSSYAGQALSSFISQASVAVSGGMGNYTTTWQYDTPSTAGVSANHYPPLTAPWYIGQDGSKVFYPNLWERSAPTSSITSNGLFKLDFFYKDRATIAGLPSLPVEEEQARFRCVQSFAGRIFYGGLGSGKNSGKILYSQIIVNAARETIPYTIGQCFQENDPTSDFLSDLLDTDGGVIEISEAVNIKRLHPYNDSLFVFADNGVWQISGVDGRFSPTAYFVRKITSEGADATSSIVSVEGLPFWWSKNGIHTITFNETNGFPIEQNLSIETIQTYFEQIPALAKSRVIGDYDTFNKRIHWFYADTDDVNNGARNKVLTLDIPLKAFYPWKVSGAENAFVIGSFYTEPLSTATIEELVTDVSDVTVTSSLGDVFVNSIINADEVDTRLVLVYNTGSDVYFGHFASINMVDFEDSAYEQSYDTFFEVGYNFVGDLTLKKNAPYVTLYLRSTEEGFTGNSTDGYTPINPSSLFVKAFWDFKSNESSTQQAYRIKPFTLVNPLDLTNNQQDRTVHTTRLKIRGRGRSVRLRFESEPGKNFIFLGYGFVVAANDRF